jgi:beta-lactamase class C
MVAAQRADEERVHLHFGADAAGQPLRAHLLLPVASVTKLATTLALLRLVAGGVTTLDTPLAQDLPDAAMALPGVTWRRLLSHTAGQPIDVESRLAPYAEGLTWPQVANALLQTAPQDPIGRTVRYSNVGCGLAAIFVERATEQPFAQALEQLVLQPLDVPGLLGDPGARPTATTGGNLGEHASTPLETYNRSFWRSLALPWAGLFTTVAGALALVRAFDPAADDGFLPAALRSEAVTDQSGGVPGGFGGWIEWIPSPWGLGAELRGSKSPHYAGPSASPASWGHLGASGALAWMDPDAGVAWSLWAPRTAASWLRAMHLASEIILTAARR